MSGDQTYKSVVCWINKYIENKLVVDQNKIETLDECLDGIILLKLISIFQ
jgi:hypothetical protein